MTNKENTLEEIIKHCANCTSAKNVKVLTDYDRTLMKCTNCDLMYVSPRPSESSVKKYFAEEYIPDNNSISTSFTQHRAASLEREAMLIQTLKPEGGSLIDIGAASGFFLSKFAQLSHWNVLGIEPSPFAAKSGSERYNIEIRSGFLEDQQLTPLSFDVITSLDAFILHVNPVRDLIEFHRILKDDGYLIFEIPGLKYRFLKGTGIVSKLFYGGKTKINLPLHNFYYTTKTLTEMVEKRGFQLVSTMPEQSPVHGTNVSKIINSLYFRVTSFLYNISAGKIHYAPKEILVFKKIA